MKDVKFYLTYAGVETELAYAPDGWDEELMTWERSKKYFGMFRSFSIPLRFVRDGAYILRSAFYTYGVDAAVTVRICKRNRKTNDFDTKYTGIIDFAAFVDSADAVEVNIKDSGASAFIKNRSQTKETFIIPAGKQLNMTTPVANYEVLKASNQGQDYVGIAGSTAYGPAQYNVPFCMGENNFNNINNCLIVNNSNDYTFSDTYHYDHWLAATRSCTIRLTINAGQIKYMARQITNVTTDTDGITMQVRVIKRTISGDELITSYSGVSSTMEYAGGYKTYYGASYGGVTPMIDLVAGDKIVLEVYAESDIHEQFDFSFYCQESATIIQCDIYSDFLATINVMTALDLFEALAYRISGGTVGASSSFLTNNPILLTSGDGIRRITQAQLVTTFDDFFDFLRSIDDVGFGVENIGGADTYVIERIDHFMNVGTLAFDAGESANGIAYEIANEMIYSQVSIGPEDGKYEDTLGKDEFNQEQVWKFPIVNVTSELKLRTKYCTDCMSVAYEIRQGIAETVYGYIEEKNRDGEKDNHVFAMIGVFSQTILGVDYYNIDRSYTITGCTYSDNMFNAYLSPKRCLIRHGLTVGSMIFPSDGNVEFQSAERNANAYTQAPDESVHILEKDDFSVTAFGARLFYPIYVTAQIPALWAHTESDVYGYVTLTHNGITLYGFIMEISAAIAHDMAGTIKLLLTSQNDIQDLIR